MVNFIGVARDIKGWSLIITGSGQGRSQYECCHGIKEQGRSQGITRKISQKTRSHRYSLKKGEEPYFYNGRGLNPLQNTKNETIIFQLQKHQKELTTLR